MDSLQNGLSRAENALSYISRIPIVGTLSGITKVAMGTIQTVAGFGGTVVGACARMFGNKRILSYSLDQMKNGIGNVAAGTVEAIPLVGTASWYLVRKHHCQSEALKDVQHKGADAMRNLEEHREETHAPMAMGFNPTAVAARRVRTIFSGFKGLLDSQEIKFVHYHTLTGRVSRHHVKEQ